MLTKELTCYVCSYCGIKFDNAAECLRHEAMHIEGFKSEKNLFDKFITELNAIKIEEHKRPTVKVTETIMVPNEDGVTDEDGEIIQQEKEVEREVPGELESLYCSKCMRPIDEGHQYVSAFGYTLCLDCFIPVLKSFAKNYGNFKSQFLTYMNMINPHFTRFTTDDKGNIIEDRSKSMIIHNLPRPMPFPGYSDMSNSESAEQSDSCGCSGCKHVH